MLKKETKQTECEVCCCMAECKHYDSSQHGDDLDLCEYCANMYVIKNPVDYTTMNICSAANVLERRIKAYIDEKLGSVEDRLASVIRIFS